MEQNEIIEIIKLSIRQNIRMTITLKSGAKTIIKASSITFNYYGYYVVDSGTEIYPIDKIVYAAILFIEVKE